MLQYVSLEVDFIQFIFELLDLQFHVPLDPLERCQLRLCRLARVRENFRLKVFLLLTDLLVLFFKLLQVSVSE